MEFIAIDNGYHKIEQWQLDRLKAEIAKGYPMILCLHAPLYAPDIYDYTAEVFGKPMWMMSVPDALMDKSDEGDYLAQKEDAVTHEAYGTDVQHRDRAVNWKKKALRSPFEGAALFCFGHQTGWVFRPGTPRNTCSFPSKHRQRFSLAKCSARVMLQAGNSFAVCHFVLPPHNNQFVGR